MKRSAFVAVLFADGSRQCHNWIHKRERHELVIGYLGLLVAWVLFSGALLSLAVLLTNPLQIGPIGVTAWFLVLLSFLAAVISLVLYTIKSFLKVGDSRQVRLRYSWRQGLLLAGYAAGLLALSSLQQFNLRDAILLGLLLVIVEVYVRFRWP